MLSTKNDFLVIHVSSHEQRFNTRCAIQPHLKRRVSRQSFNKWSFECHVLITIELEVVAEQKEKCMVFVKEFRKNNSFEESITFIRRRLCTYDSTLTC